MARASKASCDPDDLRRRGSAVRGALGYANRHGRCSNRNALPICVTSHSRQLAANRSCCIAIMESAASLHNRGVIIWFCSGRSLRFAVGEPWQPQASSHVLPDSRRRRLSHQTAPTPIPSHGRREGAPLAPHAACWAVRMSMAAAHATLAAGLGGRRQV